MANCGQRHLGALPSRLRQKGGSASLDPPPPRRHNAVTARNSATQDPLLKKCKRPNSDGHGTTGGGVAIDSVRTMGFFWVQTLAGWQSPLTRRHSREFSESDIRAAQCYDCPTAQCGSGHDTEVGQAESETRRCSAKCHSPRFTPGFLEQVYTVLGGGLIVFLSSQALKQPKLGLQRWHLKGRPRPQQHVFFVQMHRFEQYSGLGSHPIALYFGKVRTYSGGRCQWCLVWLFGGGGGGAALGF